MTRPDLAALRRLAEAATPGPWTDAGYMDYGHDDVFGCDVVIGAGEYAESITYGGQEGLQGSVVKHADAAFIAAANPATILSLLNRLERLHEGFIQARDSFGPDSDLWHCWHAAAANLSALIQDKAVSR